MTGAGRAAGGMGGILAACALGFLLGAALQLRQPALWPTAHYAIGVGCATLVIGAAWRWHRVRWLAVIGLVALAFSATALRAQWRLADALPAVLEGQDLVLTGRVSQMPHRTPEGMRFAFEVEQAAHLGRVVELPQQISLSWSQAWQDEPMLMAPYAGLAAGQRWRFTVRLKQVHGSLNPNGFDFELWMFEQGFRASGAVRATEANPATLLESNAGVPIERLRQRIRDAIDARVRDARAAGVLAALAVGDQGAIERHDWELFRTTGIAHLVSISGLHVTMFGWLAGALVGRLWRRSERAMTLLPAGTAARWGGVLAATAYALLAGWGVPAQRTVWTLMAAAVLMQLGLRWPWPLVLLVVAAIVTAIDPWALLQAGFWLSFVAVGLLLVSEPVSRERAAVSPRIAMRIWHALRDGLRTQLIATLGLAPLTLVFFQQLSLVGFIANLFAIPLVTLLITPLALLGVFVPPLWLLAAWLVQTMSAALTLLASWPAAVWAVAVAPWWAQAAALLGAALLVMPLPWRLRALALPLVLPLLWPAVEHPREGAMQILVADVGQGSAILVRTHAHALLHDTGAQFSRDSDAGTRVLVPLLQGLGVRKLDLLMLSHRDNDHTGGAAAVLATLPVAAMSSSLEEGHPLRAPSLPHRRCEAGHAWRWDGVDFRVLHPTPADYARPNLKPNTVSCVLSVTDAQGHRVLLTGDLEADQEQRLVREEPAALRSDVLVVPHHGSKTSSSAAFLDAVAPRLALVQAGYRNRYGHPAPDIVARYRERGIALANTVECGAWTSPSETGPAQCERRARQRYWHHGLEVAPLGASAITPGETAPWPSMSR